MQNKHGSPFSCIDITLYGDYSRYHNNEMLKTLGLSSMSIYQLIWYIAQQQVLHDFISYLYIIQ